MTDLVSETTRDELREMLENPDEGLELREEIRKRIVGQKKEVASGKRGEALEDVAQKLELS